MSHVMDDSTGATGTPDAGADLSARIANCEVLSQSLGTLKRTMSTELGGPIVHQPPPTLEQVGACVNGLDLVLDHVRQRRLDDLARMVCLLRRPVPERRPEGVRHSGDAATSRWGSASRCVTMSFCGPSTGSTRSQGLSFRRSMAIARSRTDRTRWRTARAVSALTY